MNSLLNLLVHMYIYTNEKVIEKLLINNLQGVHIENNLSTLINNIYSYVLVSSGITSFSIYVQGTYFINCEQFQIRDTVHILKQTRVT